MKYFGKVFVEFWDHNNRKWCLAAIPWHHYLYGYFVGVIGSQKSDKDFRHVPRNCIRFEKYRR